MAYTANQEIENMHLELSGLSVETNEYSVKSNETSTITANDTLFYGFNKGSEQGPTNKNLIDRMCSLIVAGQNLVDEKKRKELNWLESNFRKKIAEDWNLDEARKISITEYNKILKKVRLEYAKFLENEVIPQIITYTRKPNQTTSEAIEELRQAETNYLSKRGRPRLYVEYTVPSATSNQANEQATQRFSYQKPIGRYTQAQVKALKEKKDPILTYNDEGPVRDYTHTCYKRNTEGRASFTKQTIGRINGNKPKTTMVFYRASSMPAIGIEDDILRMSTAIRTAHQNIENIADDVVAKLIDSKSITADKLAKKYNTPTQALTIRVDELRLLSVLNKKIPANFDPQKGYQQTLETWLAYNIIDGKPFEAEVHFPDGKLRKMWIKPDTSVMDFGVNVMRREIFSDPLQAWMNIQAFNKLFLNTANFLHKNSVFESHFSAIGNSKIKIAIDSIFEIYEEINFLSDLEINNSKKQLDNYYKKLSEFATKYEQTADPVAKKLIKESYEETLNNIQLQLKSHHKIESTLFSKLHEIWHQHKGEIEKELKALEQAAKNVQNLENKQGLTLILNILDNFNNAEAMFSKKNYNKAENNYSLQSSITRLNYYIEHNTIIGCNDDKDRGGRLANTIEADDEFNERYGHSPRHDNKDDINIVKKAIQPIVHLFSSSYYRGGLSAPGAVDFEIHSSDGNAHLPLKNSFMAKLGKGIFNTSIKLAIKEFFTIKLPRMFAAVKHNDATQQDSPVTNELTSTAKIDQHTHADGENAKVAYQHVVNDAAQLKTNNTTKQKTEQELKNVVEEIKPADKPKLSESAKITRYLSRQLI